MSGPPAVLENHPPTVLADGHAYKVESTSTESRYSSPKTKEDLIQEAKAQLRSAL
jgi:hypothetical protein